MTVDSITVYTTPEMVVTGTLVDAGTPAVVPVMPARAGIDVFLSL